MSIIKDTFFGGAEKKAAKSQQQGIERGIQATERATEQARRDLGQLFPQARQDLQQGFQGALDVFGQSLPAQAQAFQQGNVNAQEALLAGLPQFQNAILGGQVDFSQLQPTQVQTPGLGFFQQTLPQVQLQQQNAALNGGLGAYTPNNPAFTGMMGPFQGAGTTINGNTLPTINNAFPAQNQQQALPSNFNAGADINAFNKDRFRFGR